MYTLSAGFRPLMTMFTITDARTEAKRIAKATGKTIHITKVK